MGKNLEFEALDALRGASEVRDHLLKLLNVGVPSISDLAYAVKVRIKDDFKLVEKVKKKRVEKPDYRMNDVRDVVGVRIVTLYILDALSIIPLLLDRIAENSGEDKTTLFLNNPVEEIKIYSVNPTGDIQKLASRLQSMFQDRGFGARCEVVETPQNYSSTHIVAWTRGRWANKLREIPVEIQIRTALEDVWGEMDHKLKYKREKSLDTSDETNARIENCLAHLNVMKTLNDGLAQYGDQVKIQMDELEETVKRAARFRLAEEPLERLLSHAEFEGDLRHKVQHILGVAREAHDGKKIESSESTTRLAKLREAARVVHDSLNDVSLFESTDDELNAEIKYVLLMEEALLEFEIGRILGKSSGNSHLLKSREIYQSIEEKYKDRGAVHYRVARVLYEISEREQAIQKMKGLVERFGELGIKEGHWIRASVYRILGFWQWDNAVTRRAESEGETDSETFQSACAEAIASSLSAKAISVTEPPSPDEAPHESSRVMATSNCIFFIVEFLENGGDWDRLAALDLSEAKFRIFIAEVSQFNENEPADYHKLNTLRRAHILLGEGARSKHFAELAVRNLEDAGYHDRGGNSEPEYVLRECRKSLRVPG